MKQAIIVSACIALVALCCGAGAVELRFGRSVTFPADTPVTQDILAAGNSVIISPDVQADVTAAGQTVTVSGAVADSAMLAGNSVTLSGAVGNDAWLAGNTVTLSSRVADTTYIAGSTVSITDEASVGSDALVAGSTVTIEGDIGGDLRVAGSNVTIAGTVGGDVYAQTDRLRLARGALVRGDVLYRSARRAQIDPGARVQGHVRQQLPPRERARPVFWGGLLWWLWWVAAGLIFGTALLLLFPGVSQAAAQTLKAAFWVSVGVGFLALVVTPVACVLLGLTLIGIPLAVAVFLVYLVLLHAAGIFASLALGQWVLARVKRPEWHPIAAMAIGLVVLAIVAQIPILGWIVGLLAVTGGLGAFLMGWWRRRTEVGTAARPA